MSTHGLGRSKRREDLKPYRKGAADIQIFDGRLQRNGQEMTFEFTVTIPGEMLKSGHLDDSGITHHLSEKYAINAHLVYIQHYDDADTADRKAAGREMLTFS